MEVASSFKILASIYRCTVHLDINVYMYVPKFAGSNPAEAVGFLKGDKNPQHAFLRKGSKIIGPMSQICGM